MSLASRRALRIAVAALAAVALMLPATGPASANHPSGTCFDLDHPSSSETAGNPHTLTGILKQNGSNACNGSPTSPSQNLVVNFEIFGPNDPDGGDTPATPDRTCTITTSQTSCSVTYTGTANGTDTIRAWLASHNPDLKEGADESSNPGAPEPDTTDLLTTTWSGGGGGGGGTTPATLDCDDSGPTDTERETNPRSGAGSTETYVCTVRDANGALVTGTNVTVKGENETGVNDPPAGSDDNAGYDTPDYSCTTGNTGTCQINVAPTDDDVGTTTICFYTGNGSLCSNENIAEAEANDLADRVELTWENRVAARIEAEPETDSNELGQNHVVTARVYDQFGAQFSGNTKVNLEFFNGSPTDTDGNSQNSPDRSCTTSSSSDCTITYTQTSSSGTDLMCVYLDGTSPSLNGNNGNGTCGGDGLTEPGDASGAFDAPESGDDQDVVQKIWLVDQLTMTPAADTSSVGTCNPFTIKLLTPNGQPVVGATIDVEQIHSRSTDNTANNEPTVSFCTPGSGANRSGVDTARGDLIEAVDDKGTAGGETTSATDAAGVVTIGISVTPGQGSDGSGTVAVTAFAETGDNDDPDTGEPKDTSTKTWVTAAGRTIDCEPENSTRTAGDDFSGVCTVRDRFGDPLPGISVTLTETGPGVISSDSVAVTDATGSVIFTLRSNRGGEQIVTGTLTDDLLGSEPIEMDDCDRAANDPAGAPAGVCADSITVNWNPPPQPECNDGVDNDGDGDVDHPLDDGCSSASDNSEDTDGDDRPEICRTPGAIVGNNSPNTLTGTEGDDIICGLGGDDVLVGNGGDDIIIGGGGNDILNGGEGIDILRGARGRDVLSGGTGVDLVTGGRGDDTLRGKTGADDIVGGRGDDDLRGGKGHDAMRGGRGNDALLGGRGRDTLNGGSGNDFCRTGPGKDLFRNCEA